MAIEQSQANLSAIRVQSRRSIIRGDRAALRKSLVSFMHAAG